MAEEKRAVILFADILGSTEFAGMETRGRYNEMLRAFQHMAYTIIDSYKKAEGLGNERVHAGGVGDECHVFLVGGRRNEDECHAMRLAVRLKQGWMNSDFGKHLAELASAYGHERAVSLAVVVRRATTQHYRRIGGAPHEKP